MAKTASSSIPILARARDQIPLPALIRRVRPDTRQLQITLLVLAVFIAPVMNDGVLDWHFVWPNPVKAFYYIAVYLVWHQFVHTRPDNRDLERFLISWFRFYFLTAAVYRCHSGYIPESSYARLRRRVRGYFRYYQLQLLEWLNRLETVEGGLIPARTK